MASCSIREELIAEYPTCIDYTTISSPTVTTVPIPHGHSNFNQRSINEDEEREMVHVMKYREGRIIVYNYQGHELFNYPDKNFNHRFRPRGMCIRNNIVYVTSLMSSELFIFTTEGDLITLFKHSFQEGVKISLTRPRGVVSDENNNIYICTTNELVVMNSALPVSRKHVINKARPKEVQLFKKEIVILCWEHPGVSFNILSLACVLLRTIFLREFERGTKPWYFDIDNYGNFVIPNQNLNCIYVYSNDGKMIVNQPLELIVKPRGIKLLNHKRSIGISSYSPFGFCIF